MTENSPDFLHSCILNRRGGSEEVDLPSIVQWTKEQGVLWLHIDVNDDASRLWLTDSEAHELREEADRITRYLEDLELARERTMVLREEFLGQLAQEQNSRMYVLSVVAAVFLPLTFITGLLGMNVGGLPGLDNPKGFVGSVIAMLVAAVALVALFRSKKWL